MEGLIFVAGIVFLIWLLSRSKGTSKSDAPKKEEIELTPEFVHVLSLLNDTNESVFITGKAGTGKSSLLRYFISNTRKKHVVLAPTGIAALNVSGQTIHSFFRFPPAIIDENQIRPDYVRADLFENLEMIIIDEVSMVRSDLMNGVDLALRKNRNRLTESFGGVQMVFIGDLFQLPPVVTSQDRNHIINNFGGGYFFDAPVFKTYKYHFKELTRIFRQSKEQVQFKNLLNNVRINAAQFEDMKLLNSRHKDNAGPGENAIFLTSIRDIAKNINADKLDLIQSPLHTFEGMLSGKYRNLTTQNEDQLDNKLPAPYKLKLKVGAQIMMLKNDSGRRWANGSIGKVVKLSEDGISVRINSNTYKVEKEVWKEVEYVLNSETDQIESKTSGTFTQYPIQLAFAMTIHKSQGKTFDKITVDIGAGAFAHGQIYVALSRCRTFEGITLNNPINDNDIIVDPRVVQYYKDRSIVRQTVQLPRKLTREALLKAISNNETIVIDYQNFNGELTKRKISNIQITNKYKSQGYTNEHIVAYCHLREEERNFKIDRIISIEIEK
ncbi:MAG: AAA family ATPase [Cyclobacteriaceae bacterium]